MNLLNTADHKRIGHLQIIGAGIALGLAGAALATGAIGATMWAGSHGPLGAVVESPTASQVAVVPTPEPSPSLFAPTAPPTSAPMRPCKLADLAARVTTWTGAAGNRIATVVMTNNGSVPCTIPSLQQPRLIDGAGHVLIDGDQPSNTHAVVIQAGGHVSTEVDDANYCGNTAKAPVTVGFSFEGQDDSGYAGLLEAEPRTPTDTFGVPECLGPTGPGIITMHPWGP